MKILLCMLIIPLCATAMDVERTKDLMVNEGKIVHKQNSSVSCSNDDIAHIEACGGIAFFLCAPVCGMPAVITSLFCLFDATKRFEEEKRLHQADSENND